MANSPNYKPFAMRSAYVYPVIHGLIILCFALLIIVGGVCLERNSKSCGSERAAKQMILFSSSFVTFYIVCITCYYCIIGDKSTGQFNRLHHHIQLRDSRTVPVDFQAVRADGGGGGGGDNLH